MQTIILADFLWKPLTHVNSFTISTYFSFSCQTTQNHFSVWHWWRIDFDATVMSIHANVSAFQNRFVFAQNSHLLFPFDALFGVNLKTTHSHSHSHWKRVIEAKAWENQRKSNMVSYRLVSDVYYTSAKSPDLSMKFLFPHELKSGFIVWFSIKISFSGPFGAIETKNDNRKEFDRRSTFN